MDRFAEILKFVSKSAKGIEIAPWFAPIAPKSAGYNVTILDVFTTEDLRRRGAADPNIPKETIDVIETVDFVGSAVEIATIVGATDQLGTFDYIISSHNFEHLPNPIKFLQGCQKVLKPGGTLSMAIPDHRACFDHFRPHTTIADWLEAYFEDRQRPKLSQVFAQTSYACELKNPPGRETAFFADDNAAEMRPNEVLRESYNDWLATRESADTSYRDAHCSVLTITSIQLLIAEAKFLGLIDLEVKAVAGLNGCEFFIHLENAPAKPETAAEFYPKRARLFQQVANEIAQSSAWGWSVQHAGPSGGASPGAINLRLATITAPGGVLPEQEELRDLVVMLAKNVQDMQASPVWRIAAAAARNRLLRACYRLFFRAPAAP